MKNLKIIIFLSVFMLACFSCEKTETYDGEDDKEQDVWQEDEPEDDGSDDGGGISLGDEVDVRTFCTTPIYAQVWVKGYIVGAATGANGKTRYEFEPPFHYDTAILMADKPVVDDDTEFMPVCLTGGSKTLREMLNLVSHPENKGKRLRVFGFQETYLKKHGIKKIDGYEF